MSPQMCRVVGGLVMTILLVTFFAGLAHVRQRDCEKRRLAIIKAANIGRTGRNKLPLDTKILYSPSQLLKKLGDPVAYEHHLIARLKERTAVIQKPNFVHEVLIDEHVFIRNQGTLHTEEMMLQAQVEAPSSSAEAVPPKMESKESLTNMSQSREQTQPSKSKQNKHND